MKKSKKLVIKAAVTLVFMLLTFGWTFLYKLFVDCYGGNVDGVILLVVTMGVAAWCSTGEIIKELEDEQ